MKKMLLSAALVFAAINFANAQDVKPADNNAPKTEKCAKCAHHKGDKKADGNTSQESKKCDKKNADKKTSKKAESKSCCNKESKKSDEKK